MRAERSFRFWRTGSRCFSAGRTRRRPGSLRRRQPRIAPGCTGDILLSWKRTTAIVGRASAGTFRSPLDWRVFELEEAPRGPSSRRPARLEAVHCPASAGIWTGHNIDTIVRARFAGRHSRRGSVVFSQWGRLRPDLIDGMILGELRIDGQPVGKRPARKRSHPDERLQRMAAARRRSPSGRRLRDRGVAALAHRLGRSSTMRANRAPPSPGKPDPIPPFLERAKEEFSRALSVLPADTDVRYPGALHTLFAHEIIRTNNQDRQPRVFDEAISLIEREQPDSLTLAEALHLNYMANARNDPAAARAAVERALAIRRRLAPNSALMALNLADVSGEPGLPAGWGRRTPSFARGAGR